MRFEILFLLIDIDPIFFKYQPNIGIRSSSFFNINIGELKSEYRNAAEEKLFNTKKAGEEFNKIILGLFNLS